ncbi:MAG: hypothetical protein ABEH64_10880, partial [Salinirussus sp.]
DTDVADPAIEPVARLLRDYQSSESAVLLRGSERTALATGPDTNARDILATLVTADGSAEIASTDAQVDERAIVGALEEAR